MKSILASILSPLSREEFVFAQKNQDYMILKDKSEAFPELFNLSYLESIEGLISKWPYEVKAHLPDVNDEASSLSTNSVEGYKLYQNGMPLLFNHAERIDNKLQEICTQLCEDMGLSKLTIARNIVYVTPKGAGNSAHFDQNVNVIFQVKGVKRWRFAKNFHVPNPLTRHTIGLEMDEELASYAHQGMPNEMPQDYEEVNLCAGDILILPRGLWHETKALEDSIALNFTFSPPSWLDLVNTFLRAQLAQSPYWRETAFDLKDSSESSEKLNELLAELKFNFQQLSAEDILAMCGDLDHNHFNSSFE